MWARVSQCRCMCVCVAVCEWGCGDQRVTFRSQFSSIMACRDQTQVMTLTLQRPSICWFISPDHLSLTIKFICTAISSLIFLEVKKISFKTLSTLITLYSLHSLLFNYLMKGQVLACNRNYARPWGY